MITEYAIAYGDTMKELVQMVNALILQGWQPIGGIAVAAVLYTEPGEGIVDSENKYRQAMVLPSSEREVIE